MHITLKMDALVAREKIPALTVCQPWAWAIMHAGKIYENRTWRDGYTGPLLIHAGKSQKYLPGGIEAIRGFGFQCPDATDFVFGASGTIPAKDPGGARLGMVLLSGSMNVPAGAVHLGEFTVEASPDATGAFRVFVRTDGSASMLLDSQNQMVRFSVASPVEISIGTRPKDIRTDR